MKNTIQKEAETMTDAPNQEIKEVNQLEFNNGNLLQKTAYFANIALIIIVYLTGIKNMIISPANELSVWQNVALLFAFTIFLVPNMLTILALSQKMTVKKSASVLLVVWCFFILVGVLAVEQTVLVNAICAVLFTLNVYNLYALSKLRDLSY